MRERLSRSPGCIGGWAFSAIGKPTYAFEIDEVLSRFGSFPDYVFEFGNSSADVPESDHKLLVWHFSPPSKERRSARWIE